MFKNSITCTVCPDFTTKYDHRYKQHCLSQKHFFNAHGTWPEGKKYKVSKDKSEISRLKEEISSWKNEHQKCMDSLLIAISQLTQDNPEESRLKKENSKLKKENKILREGLMDMKRQVQEVLAAVYKKSN
jgi:ribonuclease I